MQKINTEDGNIFNGLWTSINNLELEQRKDIIVKLLRDLNSKDRSIVSLFYYENLTVPEISDIMELGAKEVQGTLSFILMSLKDLISSNHRAMGTIFH